MLTPSLQHTLCAIITITAACAHPAMGCLGCYQPVKKSLLGKVEESDEVVFAKPVDLSASTWKVVEPIKGTRFREGQVIVADSTKAAARSDALQLLRRLKGANEWIAESTIDPETGRFLRDATHLSATSPQLLYFWRYLEHRDSRIAESAYFKLAGAPYAELRKLEAHLDRDQLLARISDPAAAAQRGSLYVTLLGICGEQSECALVEQWIADKWNRGDSDGLSALLIAYVELKGEEAVGFIEQSYIRDRDRQLGEISAAIDALRVHGDTDAAIGRTRVLTSYHRLLNQRPQLIELIAPDCARWRDSSFVEPFARIRSSNQYPWTHAAIDSYLQAFARVPGKLLGESR